MKLLDRSTYYFFVFSIIALVVAGFVFYYSIRTIVYRQIDNSLIMEKTIIQDQIEETDSIPDFSASFGHQIEVRILDSPTSYSQIIRDTSIYDARTRNFLQSRYIKFKSNTKKNTGYVISIYHGLKENQELLDSIALGMIFIFLALLLVSIIVNYFISKKLWHPFYNALNEANSFNILSDKPLKLSDTGINEFRQLNKVFEQMTTKMRMDYLNLKEFNENSSHEIQTPLSVIRSKLDILMQNQRLNKKSMDLIKSVNEAATRILKLNQGLLLISKIENLQFPETREISLKDLIENYLKNYEEILQLRKIRIETEFSDKAIIRINEILADVLISNLLGNAFRYNVDGGFIICSLSNQVLTITNSGLPLEVDPELLFNRFRKGADHPEAVGLGLSIVKKIVDYYKMKISYTCKGTVHEIKLNYRGEAIL